MAIVAKFQAFLRFKTSKFQIKVQKGIKRKKKNEGTEKGILLRFNPNL